jgi:hypothetical protein
MSIEEPISMVGGGTSERIKRMNSMRLRLGLFVLLALLAGPGLAHARPSRDESPRMVEEPRLSEGMVRAWSWLVSTFQKAGSFIDPLGVHPPQSTGSPVQPDAGSFIDPLGGS